VKAVIVLETLGLVRSMPGKGVVVLEANPGDSQSYDNAVSAASLEDVLQLRYTLEPFIVGLVAQSISSKEVGQLRLTLMDMREALEANDSEAGVNAYIAFHEALFTLTSNPIFQSVVQQTSNALKQSAEVLRNSPNTGRTPRRKRSRGARDSQQEQRPGQRRDASAHSQGQRMGIELNIPEDNFGS
jgi:GntR family transcriptional repressor for pyruvate dehydrogenase complex